MRLAIVGGGIAGLGAARLLHERHEITLFEAGGHAGGHCTTLEVPDAPAGAPVPVDVGFIVYNEPGYPNLTKLFDWIGAETCASDMSFSVSLGGGAFEYAGDPRRFFGQRRNLARPRSWRILRDIRRFYRDAPALARARDDSRGLGEYLAAERYSRPFVRDHLLPMAAAIWSAPPGDVLKHPLASVLRFFRTHGLLLLKDRPQWRTLRGGSQTYVRKLIAPFEDRIRLDSRVVSLTRTPVGILLNGRDGPLGQVDAVVFACPAPRALAILGGDATLAEREVLSAFRYSPNRVLLHGDAGLMPRRRALWSSWNVLGERRLDLAAPASVTYWMNRLQPLATDRDLFVSLNPRREPDPGALIAALRFEHPRFTAGTLRAQRALKEIQGARGYWFCGSYCGDGFHEDALQAGLTVAAALGAPAPWSGDIEPTSPAAGFARPRPERMAAA